MSKDIKIDELQRLATFIENQYDAGVVHVHPLASSWKQVYRVERADSPHWVVRLYPAPNGDSPAVAVETQTIILEYLERCAYLAERVVHARDGARITTYEGQQVLVTTYLGTSLQAWHAVVGEMPLAGTVDSAASFAYTPAAFQAWGAALGELHTLPLDSAPSIPVTNERPAPQLAWVSESLTTIAARVPTALQAQYAELTQALQAISRCEDLPFTLIHGDCGLSNAIFLPSGQVALIDWDWAGLGPAVLDVGWLLSCCFSKEQLTIQHAAIIAIVDGYCQHRRLTTAELERLPDATQFHTLKLLAVFFPQRIEQGWPDDALIYGATYATWRAQYSASVEIARLARVRFEHYL